MRMGRESMGGAVDEMSLEMDEVSFIGASKGEEDEGGLKISSLPLNIFRISATFSSGGGGERIGETNGDLFTLRPVYVFGPKIFVKSFFASGNDGRGTISPETATASSTLAPTWRFVS